MSDAAISATTKSRNCSSLSVVDEMLIDSMTTREPPLTLGIEEEYLLVDRETGAVASEPPEDIFVELNTLTAGRAFPEFLRAQVEVATPVCADIPAARRELTGLRSAVIEVTGRYGLAPIAASSHPFSLSSRQKRTDKERYVALLEEMQGVARRMQYGTT